MSDTSSLTVNFYGICTHFHHFVLGFVPGVDAVVPHRVVLGRTLAVRPDLLITPDSNPNDPTTWIPYCLMPHSATVRVVQPNPGNPVTTGTIVLDGTIISGARVSVKNIQPGAVGNITYNNWDIVDRLTKFIPDYKYSREVVLEGRASLYFDIMGGTITASNDNDPNKPTRVTAAIPTDGPPQLLIEPFDGPALPLITVTEENPTIEIRNLGPGCDDSDALSGYDFLLHYLTNVRGIPRTVTSALPAMPVGMPFPNKLKDAVIRCFTDMVNGTPGLGTSGGTTGSFLRGFARGPSGPPTEDDQLPSCSDAGYP